MTIKEIRTKIMCTTYRAVFYFTSYARNLKEASVLLYSFFNSLSYEVQQYVM